MLKAESHLPLHTHSRASLWHHRSEWRIDTQVTEMLSCSFYSMLLKLYSWLGKSEKKLKQLYPPQHTSVSGLEVIWDTTKSFYKSYHKCLTFNQSIWNKIQPLLVSQCRLRPSNCTKSYSGDYLNTKEETGSTKWLLYIFFTVLDYHCWFFIDLNLSLSISSHLPRLWPPGELVEKLTIFVKKLN